MDREGQKGTGKKDAGMTAREYLSQAYYLDQRINSKIEQVESLNDLARKAGCAISGMPRNPDRAVSSMANAVERIVDLQAEVNADIERMVRLKAEIMAVIRQVEDPELQTLLEKRYLNFHTWGQIAVDMGYNVRHLYRMGKGSAFLGGCRLMACRLGGIAACVLGAGRERTCREADRCLF